MVLFLTSSPTGDLDGKYVPDGIDTRCGFLDTLKARWKQPSRVLIITASPDLPAANDEMREFFESACLKSGLELSCFDLWDRRTKDFSREALQSYDVIFLGGGHVPTQNAFFREISLPASIRNFKGIVIGISAGTMNCAETVYSSPEEPGEAVDPAYRRFIPGLGITSTNIMPHYQVIRDEIKDGLALFDEIIIPDSIGREFVVLPDGSFVLEENGTRTINGPHYFVTNGIMSQKYE